MSEFWLKVDDFPYEVSSQGNVRRIKAIRLRSLGRDRDGYYCLPLWKGGKQYMRKAHRLVAQAFIPNPGNLPEVNHINGIKTDNRVENLEWCTSSQNRTHAFRSGLRKDTGESSHYSKLSAKDVQKIKSDTRKLKLIASDFHISEAQVSRIRRGKSRRYG